MISLMDFHYDTEARWWFQAFFLNVHPYVGGDYHFWLIFFKGVETTKQFIYVCLFKVTFYFYQGTSPLPYYVEYCFFAKYLKQN